MASRVDHRSFIAVPVRTILSFGLKALYTTTENVPTLIDHRVITDRYNPRRAAVLDKYSRPRPDILSWRVITNISAKQVTKAVLRNRLKRRWASAFTQALKDHDYYHNGRKCSAPKDGKDYIPGLKGTLEILIFSDRGVTCPHNELVGASRALVKAVKRLQSQAESSPKPVPRQKEQESTAEGDGSSSLWSKWRNLL
jgi:hypothetical protein